MIVPVVQEIPRMSSHFPVSKRTMSFHWAVLLLSILAAVVGREVCPHLLQAVSTEFKEAATRCEDNYSVFPEALKCALLQLEIIKKDNTERYSVDKYKWGLHQGILPKAIAGDFHKCLNNKKENKTVVYDCYRSAYQMHCILDKTEDEED